MGSLISNTVETIPFPYKVGGGSPTDHQGEWLAGPLRGEALEACCQIRQ